LLSRPVVSNTSPLINLAGVGHLALLPQLYTDIWIPDVVLVEYRAKMAASDPDPGSVPWLTVQSVAPDPSLYAIRALGAGEAAVITLAQTSDAQLVLLDDKSARRVARQRGLTVVGTLGVLLATRQIGLLPALQPLLDAMIAQRRRISPTLRARVLRAAGEDTQSGSDAGASARETV
jgi:predicted nucleic acid-binding protein